MKRFAVIGVLLCGMVSSWAAAPSTIDTSHQYAWGANIGWLNWRPDFMGDNMEGIIVGEFVCSGYIYSANVGWINMGSGSPANNIQYQNNSATDFGVNYTLDPTQPGVGILRGFAYGANIGWINLESLGNARLSLFTGRMSGYAYSANCGWINLDDMAGINPNYVQTDYIAMGADTNGNGIADAWEYLYFSGLLAPGGQNSLSPNGNGMTLVQDYQDGVDPKAANSGLRITVYSTTKPGGVTSSMTFTSTTARLYTIETNTDLSLPLNWMTYPTLGMFAPDAGTTTTRPVTQVSAIKRYYRVKTMRPLPPPLP